MSLAYERLSHSLSFHMQSRGAPKTKPSTKKKQPPPPPPSPPHITPAPISVPSAMTFPEPLMSKYDEASATRHLKSSAALATLPTQGDQPGGKTPYSGDGAPNGLPGYAAPGYARPEPLIAQPLPIQHNPPAPRQVCTPLPSVESAGFVGTYGIGCVVARVVAGRLVPPPQVEQFALPAADVHQRPVDGHRSSIVSSYSSLAGAICEECAGVASATNPAPTPTVAAPKHASSPDDDIFDLEALERSLANSPTGDTSSSLSDALVTSYGAPGWAIHARATGGLPAQYAGAGSVAVRGWSGPPKPEGSIWHANPGAYHTAVVEPPLNALAATSFVDTNVNTFGEVLSASPLAGATSDDRIFDGCFDKCEPLWLPQSLAYGNSVLTEKFDFACTALGSTYRPKHQTADPYTGSAVQPY